VEKIRGPFDRWKACARVGWLVVGKRRRSQSDLVASRLREAARFFENLIGNHSATDETRIKHRFQKKPEQEETEDTERQHGREEKAGSGKRWAKRVCATHLFLRKSASIVVSG